MGASLFSRVLLALAFLFLSLLVWEATVAWTRYEPYSGHLGGFKATRQGFQVREPGRTTASRNWEGLGPHIQDIEFYGARYDVATPYLLAPLLGSEPRCRLIGILGPPDNEKKNLVLPWGGGRDPLGEFLWITRPLTGWLVYLDFQDVKPERTDGSLRLLPVGEVLQLQPGDV